MSKSLSKLNFSTVPKKNKISSYVIEKLATVLKTTQNTKISKGTPGAQVHCHIVLQFRFCFLFSRVFTFGRFAVRNVVLFSVGFSFLAALLAEN